MEMPGSSSALDVSAIREDLKYTQALSVNVSNFVSVTLSGGNNYKIWKAQMLCLIESQVLLHIIKSEHPFPKDKGVQMISQYDKLVKGWIFGSMNEKVLEDFVDLGTAREVWRKLESLFNPPTSDADEDHQLDARRREIRYSEASFVIIPDYVSVKLSNHSNYHIWKAQMLCLLEKQELLHIINAEYPFRWDKTAHMISKYDILVKDWIYATMDRQLVNYFRDYSSAQSIWRKLESIFNRPISHREGDSWNAVDVSTLREDLKYIQVSNVNVSNFVSVKLYGPRNYPIWKAQMMCLIESQELLHIIEAETRYSASAGHMTKKYHNLVKGWIFGTMNDQLLKPFAECDSVPWLWRQLESNFNPPESIHKVGDMDIKSYFARRRTNNRTAGFKFTTEFGRVPEIEDTDNIILKKELYQAAVEGCWWKAKSILKVHETAATEGITENGNTILHLAVEMGHNYFVEKLLDFLKDGKDIEKKNDKGRTALHIAAMVGNTQAAQLLVQKRKQLLLILDNNNLSAGSCAFSNAKLNVSAYLLKCLLSSDSCTYSDNDQESAIFAAIFTKQYDTAQTLLKKFPKPTNEYTKDSTYGGILKAITLIFPSDLRFTEYFIYPSFHNVLHKTILRGSLLFHSNFLDKCVDEILLVTKMCNNMCCSWLGKIPMILLVATVYPIYQLICLLILVLRLPFSMLYFLLWNVFAVMVRPIKSIEKKKKEYAEAKKLLSLVCDMIGSSKYAYSVPILEAVCQDTYEVVDEILFTSPDTINCKNDEGHNIIQLAIINRSEKVYNLIYHIIERMESYRKMKDSCENTLVHLVGRLAPPSVLSRSTGAALQLQRELIWHEEVEKLMLPLELTIENIYKETPAIVFSREHQDLIKQGEIWMKTTAESCSITAALIVTVVFAAALTVPGGSNQESGIPVFKKEIAFTVFAVSNAFSLFTAATSLLFFLSILTARFSERDFLVSLPRRMIFGLLTLFLSTAAMIVAFGAILFLVFCDQRPWMLAPIVGFACLPISVIVTIKVPLLVDLILSTYNSIFGKQGYLESCKIKRKNTIFTE